MRELGARSLATKLQVPAGSAVRVINPPRGFKIDAPASSKDGAGAVLLFTKKSADLSVGKAVLEAARQDRIAWVAYPKAGKLGTDLNRDRLWTLLEPEETHDCQSSLKLQMAGFVKEGGSCCTRIFLSRNVFSPLRIDSSSRPTR